MKRFLVFMAITLGLSGCGSVGNNQEATINEGEEKVVNTVDYSDCFDGINGCAVIFDGKDYDMYNEEECNTRYSPLSTFKIVATLEGLDCGVLKDKETKMNYSGYSYPLEMWNADLNLEEAFKTSCVWYFRQVIDKIGQEKIDNALNELSYGNCDASQWMGVQAEGIPEDTNGFWLGSSLEITPVEAVDVNYKIFEGKSKYTNEEISILKDIMKSDVDGIYGKTGTGRDNTAWYSGFYEKGEDRIYFAVHLDNGDGEEVAGATAKEIGCKIMEKYKS